MFTKIFFIFIISLTIISLSSCSSQSKLSSEITRTPNTFQTYETIHTAFKSLEERIENGEKISKKTIRELGFKPTVIANHRSIVNKFTFNGNLIAAKYNIAPPSSIINCSKKGKLCTAFIITVVNESIVEIPEGDFGTFKSISGIEETHHITYWKFGCIIVFDGDIAVYSETDEDNIEPRNSINQKKKSFLKKIGRVLLPKI